MTTHVNDSGTWRELSQAYVNDSGVWRELLSIHVNDNGTWREVFVGADFVVTSGQSGTIFGFDTPTGIGSVNPTTFQGDTIHRMNSNTVGFSEFALNRGTDPGQSYFTSLRANGQEVTSASATYSYSGGLARWIWSVDLGFANGGVYPIAIT